MGRKLPTVVLVGTFKAKYRYFVVQHTAKYFLFTTLKTGQLPDLAFRSVVKWCKINLIFLSLLSENKREERILKGANILLAILRLC